MCHHLMYATQFSKGWSSSYVYHPIQYKVGLVMCHHTDVCHVLVSWTTVFHIWPQWNVTKLLWLCNIMVCDWKVVANTELWRNGIQKRGNEPDWKHMLWRQCHCSHPNYSSVVVSKHDLLLSKLKVISWTYFSFLSIFKLYIKTNTVWIPNLTMAHYFDQGKNHDHKLP